MNDYYQEIITKRSWEILINLKKTINFILIGGWAVFLYAKALKSKDIDIIVDFPSLDKLRQLFDLNKNERLKKYEVKEGGIDIDIYLPYFSNIGLPIEKILKYKETREGLTVVRKEILVITKLAAYSERLSTVKGEKDKIDILSLLFLNDFDFELYKKVIKQYSLNNYSNKLIKLLSETYEVRVLGLTKHFLAKKKKEVLNKISYLA